MLKSKRTFRLGVCGALLGAVYFGFAGSVMAWNEPLWVRQLGTETEDDALSVAKVPALTTAHPIDPDDPSAILSGYDPASALRTPSS